MGFVALACFAAAAFLFVKAAQPLWRNASEGRKKVIFGVGFTAGMLVFAMLMAIADSNPTARVARANATVGESVRTTVKEPVKCEDREARLFSFPGMEMAKRAYVQAQQRLLDGGFTPEEREALIAAMNKYDSVVTRYRADNPCL